MLRLWNHKLLQYNTHVSTSKVLTPKITLKTGFPPEVGPERDLRYYKINSQTVHSFPFRISPSVYFLVSLQKVHQGTPHLYSTTPFFVLKSPSFLDPT